MNEHQEQAAFFEYCAWKGNTDAIYKCVFAIPNGAITTPKFGRKLNNEGRMRGVFDIFIQVPAAEYHGAYIEFKFGKNKLTPEQSEFMKRAFYRGFMCKVCYTAAKAIEFLEWYLDQSPWRKGRKCQ
jgi:hypothetical protein